MLLCMYFRMIVMYIHYIEKGIKNILSTYIHSKILTVNERTFDRIESLEELCKLQVTKKREGGRQKKKKNHGLGRYVLNYYYCLGMGRWVGGGWSGVEWIKDEVLNWAMYDSYLLS